MIALSADRPRANPQDDLFGHPPFPDTAHEAINQFLKEFLMLKAGKNPDGVGAFDDLTND